MADVLTEMNESVVAAKALIAERDVLKARTTALEAENAALKLQLKPVPAPPPPPPPVGQLPAFGAGGGPFTVGKSVTRLVGDYQGGVPVAGRRYRNGVLIPGGDAVAYTITSADVGAVLVYEEEVEYSDKSRKWIKSAPATAVAAPVAPAVEVWIDDMRLPNDGILAGYEPVPGGRFDGGWYKSADVGMGTNCKFDEDSTATWSIFYYNGKYWGKVCRAILPWAAFYDFAGNGTTNVGVEMADLVARIKTKAGNWITVAGPSALDGPYYSKPDRGATVQEQRLLAKPTPTSTVVAVPDGSRFWHGWGNKVTINPDDIAAVHIRMRARLVVPPGQPDERSKALIGLQVGGDYYLAADMNYPEDYAPSLGISRTKRVTNEWQDFALTTLTDCGNQNPGRSGLTAAQFRAGPPL